MRPRCAALILSVLPAAVPLASSIAQAGPSRAGIDLHVRGAPLVGRAQTRDGLFDLTRETIAEGGSAGHLAPSVTRVLAEAEDQATRREHAADHEVSQTVWGGPDAR
jgi:hypothetical protein